MNYNTIKMVIFFLCTGLIVFNFSAKVDILNPRKTAEGFGMFQHWEGKPAPDFSIKLINGEVFTLSSRKGKDMIIINFFATWCGPCKLEIPELNTFYDKTHDNHLVLIGIEEGNRMEELNEFIQENKVRFPVGLDGDHKVISAYSVASYPTTVFIGLDGIIKLYHIGTITNADVAFKDLINAELKKPDIQKPKAPQNDPATATK